MAASIASVLHGQTNGLLSVVVCGVMVCVPLLLLAFAYAGEEEKKPDPPLVIKVGCLVPTVYAPTIDGKRVKPWKIADVKTAEKSVRRQIDFMRDNWKEQTEGKVLVQCQLTLTKVPIKVLKESRVKEPWVVDLVPPKVADAADCFLVWVIYPKKLYEELEDAAPYTHHDYMWIPSTEEREKLDLELEQPRNAANHELKHWLKNRLKEMDIAVPSPDGEGADKYWERLREALTPEVVAELTKRMQKRVAERRERVKENKK